MARDARLYGHCARSAVVILYVEVPSELSMTTLVRVDTLQRRPSLAIRAAADYLPFLRVSIIFVTFNLRGLSSPLRSPVYPHAAPHGALARYPRARCFPVLCVYRRADALPCPFPGTVPDARLSHCARSADFVVPLLLMFPQSCQ